jgi:hypothetical protein
MTPKGYQIAVEKCRQKVQIVDKLAPIELSKLLVLNHAFSRESPKITIRREGNTGFVEKKSETAISIRKTKRKHAGGAGIAGPVHSVICMRPGLSRRS